MHQILKSILDWVSFTLKLKGKKKIGIKFKDLLTLHYYFHCSVYHGQTVQDRWRYLRHSQVIEKDFINILLSDGVGTLISNTKTKALTSSEMGARLETTNLN